MLYVQESLGPQEELVYVGRFHWLYTVNAVMSIVWGLVASGLVVGGGVFMYRELGYLPENTGWLQAILYLHPAVRLAAFVIFAFGVFGFAHKMVIKATTEIAVTTDRVIYKRGMIARAIGELNIDRIEGVSVLQSFCGRIFNYGRLVVRGMGIGEVLLPPIADPLAFRQAIERAKTA
mgnify:CR=1 FL=1